MQSLFMLFLFKNVVFDFLNLHVGATSIGLLVLPIGLLVLRCLLSFLSASKSKVVQVRQAVEGIAAGRRELLVTRGRKVLELRPAVAWDKGRALLHLLKALSLHEASDVVPIYIGDDRTDEDAFKALRGRGGIGILVSSIVKPTAATFSLRDPEEVRPASCYKVKVFAVLGWLFSLGSVFRFQACRVELVPLTFSA
jgi:hypothetical protein